MLVPNSQLGMAPAGGGATHKCEEQIKAIIPPDPHFRKGTDTQGQNSLTSLLCPISNGAKEVWMSMHQNSLTSLLGISSNKAKEV